MTDFIFMVDQTSYMFITGPDVVKTVTGEEVTPEELGGATTHATKSGVATFVSADDKACLSDVRYLLSYLPSNNLEDAPRMVSGDEAERACPELATILPDNPNRAYDMKKVIAAVVDEGEFLEYFPRWAPNIVCGFARLDGYSVGIVANQPMVKAGVLDIDSSEKAGRFVRTCDAFNIPLVTFVDVPGFMPGTDQSTAASSATGPSCSTPSARRRSRGSRSSCARPTAAPTWSWTPSPSVRTCASPGRPPSSR